MPKQDLDPMMNGHPMTVEGCPVADGKASCVKFCGGGWPGTTITTESLTRAVVSGRINPAQLGCQPLKDRALIGLAQVRELRKQPEGLYDPNPVP